MDRRQRETLHRTSVAGNTVAGATGVGFGAAKLRDAYKEEKPQSFDRHVANVANRALKHGASTETVSRIAHVAQKGKPGFKPLVIASSAGAVAAGARRLSDHLQRVDKQKARARVAKVDLGMADDVVLGAARLRGTAQKVTGPSKPGAQQSDPPFQSIFGVSKSVEVAKFVPPTRKQRDDLRERVRQARKPPEPKLRKVDSSALHSVGYQRQTRRMDVTFNGRPDRRYSYRMKPKQAQALMDAPSKGRHYAKKVKGQYPDASKPRARDRARVFVQPVQKSAFGVVLVSAPSRDSLGSM